ncbi:MAG: carbonic anhydrase [Ardenticatenaceae bacterium]|nr:carbonic anhydrase [Ardenticatenaceae bacterium]
MGDTLLDQTTTQRRQFFKKESALLAKLVAEGQHPQALFIGCADSRVTPEALLGAKPGDLFMLRNIANVIPPSTQTENGIVSVLEYAVLGLHVPHIIVMGHTDCGGIKGLDAQLNRLREPALSRWLDLARPAQRDVDLALRGAAADVRHQAIVERNVVLQLKNLRSYAFIHEQVESGALTLHGWVYYLEAPGIGYYDEVSGTFVHADG